MSALTDLFTAMANKIRSKTGTQTTYTPSEMVSDGIDDVYDAGVASVPTPTSITPSNFSPVALTENTAVKPTTSGYAIASYSSVVPSSSSPATITKGEIYRATGNGYAISSYSSITPSNRSPVALTANSSVIPTGKGYAIASYDNLSSGLSNREYEYLYSGNAFYRTEYGYGSGYFYNDKPTGRVLFSYSTQPNRDSTSWYTVAFSSATKTAYDEDGTSSNLVSDETFSHYADGGQIVVDRACTVYIAGTAWYGRTSSGTAVYSGVRVLKNGTVITGASAYGSSSTTSPNFRRIEASVAVGDVITIQTRVSSTTSANTKITVNMCTD